MLGRRLVFPQSLRLPILKDLLKLRGVDPVLLDALSFKVKHGLLVSR